MSAISIKKRNFAAIDIYNKEKEHEKVCTGPCRYGTVGCGL